MKWVEPIQPQQRLSHDKHSSSSLSHLTSASTAQKGLKHLPDPPEGQVGGVGARGQSSVGLFWTLPQVDHLTCEKKEKVSFLRLNLSMRQKKSESSQRSLRLAPQHWSASSGRSWCSERSSSWSERTTVRERERLKSCDHPSLSFTWNRRAAVSVISIMTQVCSSFCRVGQNPVTLITLMHGA